MPKRVFTYVWDPRMTEKSRMAFMQQRHHAAFRGIPFELTPTEWWDIWQASGHWEERGRHRYEYCMARYGDVGPYAVGNVFIQQNTYNCSDATRGTNLRLDDKRKKSAARMTLSDDDIRAIIASNGTEQELADTYGCSRTTVKRIKRGDRWFASFYQP